MNREAESHPLLEDAIVLAAQAHRKQRDKAGEPYLLHVLRVMLRLQDEAGRIVAVLHDILEDSSMTLVDIRRAGYRDEVCSALDCLTRRPGEPYEEMIARVATNSLARQVKLADLEDNMDVRRDLGSDEVSLRRMEKYRSAQERLLAANGSPQSI